MKKDLAIIAGLFVLIVFLIVFGGPFSSLGFVGNQKSIFDQPQKAPDVAITVGTLKVNAKVADNAALRKKGLSQIESIPFDQGMLFVFENPGNYSIWMKDMKFAIDIIWLDEAKRVTDVAIDVPAQPGKKDSELIVYKPNNNAKYVLEVNAGLVNLNDIRVGDQAFFELPSQ